MSSDPRLRLRVLALPVAAGVVLRLWNLANQVLGGDELHALRAAQSTPFPAVLVTYRTADPSPPFAGLIRLFLDLDLPLSELVMRMPSLLAGVAALVALPLLAARHLGRRGAIAFAWLLAISPMLVLYSRIARPYMPVALLATLAILAFDRLWPPNERGDKIATWGTVYAIAAASAVYFHPVSAPCVLMPLGIAIAELATRRELVRPGLMRLTIPLGGVILLLTVFLVPAGRSLARIVAAKSSEGELHWPALAGTSMLQAGATRMPLAVCFWILVVLGWFVLSRRSRHFAFYGLALVIGQAVALLLVRPVGIGVEFILNRYLMPILPLVLLWAAVGMGELWNRASHARSPAVGRVLVGLLIAVLFFGGPFTDKAYLYSSFVHNNNFLLFTQPRPVMPTPLVPQFYRAIPEEGSLIEFPWPSVWSAGRTVFVYQEIHRRRVQVSSREAALQDPRLAFRNLVRPTPESFLATDARYLVIHRDLAGEERNLVYSGANWQRISAELERHFSRASASLAKELRHQWGPPTYLDSALLVWDLNRVRTASTADRTP